MIRKNKKVVLLAFFLVFTISGILMAKENVDVTIYGPYFGFEEQYFQKELDLISEEMNITIKYYPRIIYPCKTRLRFIQDEKCG